MDAAAYRANGVKASEEYYQRGTTNFAPIIQRILNQNPDAVYTASSPPADGATIDKQLREVGFDGVIGRLGGLGTAETIRAVGSVEKLGNFYWLEIAPIDSPGVKALWKEYQELMGRPAPSNTLVIPGIVSARLVLKAISKAGARPKTPKKLPRPCGPFLLKTRIWEKANGPSKNLRDQSRAFVPGRHGRYREREESRGYHN